MDRYYRQVRSHVVSFRLTYCCWFAPIRDSLLVIGYCSFFIALIYLVGSANDSFTPTLKKVQELILGDDASSTLCLFAYAVDAASCVLLLAAVHRRDSHLLRVYLIYKTLLTVVATLLYCSVITASALDVLIKIEIFAGVLIDCYILLLVWSGLVEIKQREEEKRNKEIFKALNRGTTYTPKSNKSIINQDAETTIALNNEVITTEPTLEIVRERILPTAQSVEDPNISVGHTAENVISVEQTAEKELSVRQTAETEITVEQRAETEIHVDKTNVADETPKTPPKRKLRLFRSKDKKKEDLKSNLNEEMFNKVGETKKVKEDAAIGEVRNGVENVETKNDDAENVNNNNSGETRTAQLEN